MLPYLKLLIRQRIASWNPFSHSSKSRSKVKTVLGYIGFALLAVMLYGMLAILEYFMYGAFDQLGEPQTMLALTGVLCTLLTVITSFFYIFNELFFSKDVLFVSALPISSRALLSAKLIRIWLGEAGIALAICLPVLLLYGIGQGMGVFYYTNAILLTLMIPMVPIAVVTVLSFLLIRVSALWKRREALTVIMGMLFLMAFMWAEMQLSMSSSEKDMNVVMLQLVLKQRQVLDLFAGLYPPIHWFTEALTGSGMTAALLWVGFAALNLAALGLVVTILGGAYQRLAIRQSEALTRMNAAAKKRVTKQGARSPLVALYRRELREIFIVPIYAMNSLTGAIMFPVIAAAMVFGAGSGASELALLPMAMALLPKALIAAIVTGVLAFTNSMNMAVSTAVSREGKRHEFYRTLPVQPQIQLLAKLLMGLTINLICALPMAILLFFLLPAFQWQIAIGFFASLLFSTGTAIASLMVDVNHPKFGWKSETEAIKQNGFAALSMFGAMGLIALAAGLYYGLTWLGVSSAGALAILCAVMLLADVLLVLRLVGATSRRYILQEVTI
ncbi:MAG TPA: hypothetical protein PLP25_00700 [Candidatus Limiplasma sp.]|nr:hypothetical protein [Candidatus Limiplasma sp.]HPS80362.1 hypothetical protein [Candidatus Limiplasma sp.]